jgi:hypothetical protein
MQPGECVLSLKTPEITCHIVEKLEEKGKI